MVRYNSQSGSAIIYVFVGIILFAALMYTYARTSQTSESSQGATIAKPKAIEIMARADSIARAVERLMIKGCAISQLNFYSDHYTQAGTANPSAPPDGRCDVYSASGGGIRWEPCPDPQLCSDAYLYAPMVPRSLVVDSLGSQPEDLVYVVLVRKEVCQAINAALGLPTTDLPYTSIDGSPYIGVFSKDNALPHIPSGGNYAPFIGKNSGCMYMKNYMTTWGGEYFVYYHVLVEI